MASEVSTSSVVYITTLSEYEFRSGTPFDWFFEPRTSQRVGSGSGVIVSADGYIVTNNHVINGADEIRVTQGKYTYKANLVGTDPSTDLAILKIDATGLSPLPFGKSDELRVGEWVLAVGNPFNLTSTVTAGIVSAKGRNINILKDKFPIESFIQTDAAINPGNSGGALVNQEGELVGINTAILSRTGSYAGYGFAVPANLVKKVYHDLVKYGEVQKAFLGADLVEIDSELAEKMSLDNLDGVMLMNVQNDGAVYKGGVRNGDIVLSINDRKIQNKSQAEEWLANKYPGDQLTLTIKREEGIVNKSVILLNKEGETGVIVRDIYHSEFLNAKFEVISKVEKDLLRIKNGIKIVDFENRGFFADFDLPKGFIITRINRYEIETPEEFEEILKRVSGRIELYGVNESGRKVYYTFYMR
ncbi:MAG: trypsin-like peptidase domain-containing protein [Cyclobacteriaceae bacterium]